MTNTAERPSRSGAVRTPGPLGDPMLTFDLNGEIKRLREENSWQGGRDSKTLVKNEDFRIVLTVLKANALLHEHKATGRISVHVLSGHIQMHVQDKVFDLPTGHLLALDRAVPHDVKALEDSAFLLTIAWPEKGERHFTEY
ncbi:MAG TPA: cupin domain-containing protein [Candidatus Limnocylindria bacterium]|jgi:quercetin dioxygenase-like cupin family protein|nr:cupin domain-containing protein [Candidatus Limnocylindria bacterium]